MGETTRASALRIAFALAAVYVVWGSTYLGIRFAIETLPPFGMAGVRFLISGVLLYGWARWRGVPRPQRVHWRSTAVLGAFLLLAGNGGVVWAEQRVDSGVAALLVATEPLWIVLFLWLRRGDERPTLRVGLGLALGLAGMFLLVRPGGHGIDPIGAAGLLVASMSWAWGSLYGRRAPIPGSTILTTGMQMLWGGAMLLAVGFLTGEPARFAPADISGKSVLAVGYLVVAGLVAFTAYSWLLTHTSPVLASTHAYVNPVVAVLLGWAFAGEPLTGAMLGAAAVIVIGVALITSSVGRVSRQAPEPVAAELEPEKAAA